jgi:hypothetical protein
MKLYGLVKQVWIVDEGMSIPDADSVELYESQTERDERLLYLNGGHGEDYFSRMDNYYAAIDYEVGNRNEYNNPYEEPERHSPMPGDLERLLLVMGTHFDF